MSENITTSTLRTRPGYQVVKRIKQAGWTQNRIAESVGCSQATVSCVVNRQPGRKISAELRDRIWAAIDTAVGKEVTR